MSGLEKFDGSKGAIQRLKAFLLRPKEEAQRAAPPLEELNSSAESTTSSTIDLDESFREILERHQNRKAKMDKENLEPKHHNSPLKKNKFVSLSDNNTLRYSPNMSKQSFASHNDSTLLEEPSIWRQTTDDSFENLERLCNKTLADRNSINPEFLSTYRHSKANDTVEDDERTNDLNRLLNLFNVKQDANKTNFCDQTQLNDIEAPSCLWENTLSADMTLAQQSPVKMVGLLRPSTILEESSDSLSSGNSFKSALKYAETVSSDQYETANESVRTDMVTGIQSNNPKQHKGFDDQSVTTESSYVRNNDTNASASGSEYSGSSSKYDSDIYPHSKRNFYDEYKSLASSDDQSGSPEPVQQEFRESTIKSKITNNSSLSHDSLNDPSTIDENGPVLEGDLIEFEMSTLDVQLVKEKQSVLINDGEESITQLQSDDGSNNEPHHKNEFVNTKNDNMSASEQKIQEQNHSPVITERSNFVYKYSNDARPSKSDSESSITSSIHDFDSFQYSKRKFYDNYESDSLSSINHHNRTQSSEENTSTEAGVNLEPTKLPIYSMLKNRTGNSISSDSLNAAIESRIIENSYYEDSLNVSNKSNFGSRMIGRKDQVIEENLIDLEKAWVATPKIEKENMISNISAEGSVIDLLSDDESDNDLNRCFSIKLDNSSNRSISQYSPLRVSRNFNDTIEEMDYIMQQGMKYMTATKGVTPKLKNNAIGSSTERLCKTPNSMFSPKTPNTVISKVKKITPREKPQEINFKKPNICSRIPQPKALLAAKKQAYFNHVISPVGQYIKNTATTRSTATIKPKRDVFQSKAIKELEFEARKNSPRTAETKSGFQSLPKKAYISSEYKHVVDERKQVSIPGGDKIHRYLQPSAVQTVIRHEGKIKLNMLHSDSNEVSNRTIDSSLADLSVMSGDVSVLVLKDAKQQQNNRGFDMRSYKN